MAVRGVQIAAKRGYKVIAIDTGDSKREMCLKLGATVFLDFKADPVSRLSSYTRHTNTTKIHQDAGSIELTTD